MRKPKKKSKAESRVELRRRELVVIRQIVARHVSLAWNAGAEAVSDSNPNGTAKQFNTDLCNALLEEYNLRRDWPK